MTSKDFNKKLDDGKRAAKVFALNMDLLTGMEIVAARDVSLWKVEGCDFILNVLENERIEENLHVENVIATGGTPFRRRLIYGSAEVKGIGTGKLIQRNDVSSVSVPFALWDGMTPDGCKATRKKLGSLERFFNPAASTLSAQPLALSYIAEDKKPKSQERPFMTMTFTDFPELKRRLIRYGAENEMNLLDFTTIPVGEEAWKYKRGELVFTGNMWMVPLELLIDIARIILIGDPPEFINNGSCTKKMQEQRYEYLRDHASLIIPQEQIVTEGDIPTFIPRHAIMQMLVNGLLDKLKGALLDANGNKL